MVSLVTRLFSSCSWPDASSAAKLRLILRQESLSARSTVPSNRYRAAAVANAELHESPIADADTAEDLLHDPIFIVLREAAEPMRLESSRVGVGLGSEQLLHVHLAQQLPDGSHHAVSQIPSESHVDATRE
jgi:hypothetical protein